jgi:transposase
MCGSGVRWCARADVMFDVPGIHVVEVQIDDEQRLVLTVESDQLEPGCPGCGVLAVGMVAAAAHCMTRRVWAGSRCCVG